MRKIEFQKYKRFMTFGCSFTDHIYPTWAHVLASEMPDAEFYNFGRSGAGNPLISSRVAEANQVLKFDQHDLIMIMWSSFSREDRWIDGNWYTLGNVYNNIFYDEKYLKKYADPVGYIIRDLALIELTKGYLENTGIDFVMMLSYDDLNNLEHNHIFNKNDVHGKILNDLKKKYESLLASLHIRLHNFSPDWNKGFTYINNEGFLYRDPHPSTIAYYNFLKKYEFPLTERSYNYSVKCMEKLSRCKTRTDVTNAFDEELNIRNLGISIVT